MRSYLVGSGFVFIGSVGDAWIWRQRWTAMVSSALCGVGWDNGDGRGRIRWERKLVTSE